MLAYILKYFVDGLANPEASLFPGNPYLGKLQLLESVPLMIVMMLMSERPAVMGRFTLPRHLRITAQGRQFDDGQPGVGRFRHLLAEPLVHGVIDRAGEQVPDWSGGTRLGETLKAFLDRWGARGLMCAISAADEMCLRGALIMLRTRYDYA